MENYNFITISARSSRKTSREMFPIVEQWQQSCQTQKEFCHVHGLRISTFTYWVRKYREWNAEPPEGQKFMALSVGSSRASQVEVCYPNGVTIKLGPEVGAVFIRELAGEC